MRKASASLWIASQQEVLRAAKQDTLPDTARELLNFRSCGVLLVGMEVHGGPVVSNCIFLYTVYFLFGYGPLSVPEDLVWCSGPLPGK